MKSFFLNVILKSNKDGLKTLLRRLNPQSKLTLNPFNQLKKIIVNYFNAKKFIFA